MRLLHEQQRADGDDSARECQPTQPRRDSGADYDERGHLGRRVDVVPAGGDIAGDDEADGARGQYGRENGESGCGEPTGQSADTPKQSKSPDAAKPCASASGMSRLLAFDPYSRPAKSRDEDAEIVVLAG